jgi:AraC-like DNA-binding protein
MEEAHPLLLPSGKIIAGTNNGPLMFSLDEVRKSSFSPKIVFDSPSHIELSPDERSLALTFSSIDLNSNGAALYAYKMDGIDKDWTYTRENRIQYSHLPAGDFVLRVRSANSDGVWTDNEQQLTIHRTPHFNERSAAWMLYGVLASLLAFIAFRLYRYIKSLQSAISSIQLSNSEKVEYLEARLYDALHEQKKQKAEPAESASEDITEENRLFKEKIEAFIKSRLGDPDLSVQDIAQEMAMSRSLLYLQTKNIMGCTPNNLIVEYRMEQAVRLMNDMGTNISDIAYSCGFSDPKYFARCFKKATGMTPSEYRKMKS